jgi:hypothetical protein
MTYFKLLNKYIGAFGSEESPSGCFFTTLEHLAKWYTGGEFIADVITTGNVTTAPCGTKMSAHGFTVRNIRTLSEFIDTLDQATVRTLVVQHPHILYRVKHQTEDLCLAAVRRNGFVLCFVQHQTEAICLAAVENYPTALFSVRDRTPVVCSAAVRRDPHLEFFCP